MKLHLDKQTVRAFATACQQTYEMQFENNVLQLWIREALESLIIKLAKLHRRITKPATVTLSNTHALALCYACQLALQDNRIDVILLEPNLRKQLNY